MVQQSICTTSSLKVSEEVASKDTLLLVGVFSPVVVLLAEFCTESVSLCETVTTACDVAERRAVTTQQVKKKI